MKGPTYLLAILLIGVLAACTIPVAEVPAAAETTPGEDESADAFPVTIEHRYGTTTIDAKPERVVTVGLTDQDAVLALGVTPVGTTSWIGEYPGNIFPWAADLVEGDLPEITGDTSALGFEKIAALKPDLITALYTGISEEEYELLSEIAPTVAPPEGYVDYGLPWQESTRIVGQALGESAQAEALITAVDEKIEQIRAEHPEFVGATGAVAAMYDGIWVYGPEDGRARLLGMLGFELPETLIEALPAEDFGGNLSLERADLLDLDLMVWLSFGENIEERGGPVYQSLPVYTEGREVFVDDLSEGTDSALSFVTVLSLPYLLDEFVPLVAEAMAGTK